MSLGNCTCGWHGTYTSHHLSQRSYLPVGWEHRRYTCQLNDRRWLGWHCAMVLPPVYTRMHKTTQWGSEVIVVQPQVMGVYWFVVRTISQLALCEWLNCDARLFLNILMIKCKTTVSSIPQHWRSCYFAPNHQYCMICCNVNILSMYRCWGEL